MGHKKKKNPWTAFVNRLLNRKRAEREYSVPTAYIMAVADKLHRINASREIIYNTLVEFWSVAFEGGYNRKSEDISWFKTKQNKHLEEGFNTFMDYLDDLVHCKSEEKFTFKEWEESKKNSANQNKV